MRTMSQSCLTKSSTWADGLARCALRAVLAALVVAAVLGVSVVSAGAAEQQQQPYDILPVPAVTIYPGDLIDESMLKEEKFLPGTRSLYPVADNLATLIGKVARRTLVPDRLIPNNAVAEPELVTRGSLTTAIFSASGLNMTAGVVALQSGSLGQVIQVRNIDSGRVISGVVQMDGTVRVGGR